MPYSLPRASLAAGLLLCSGCHTFSDTHYFALPYTEGQILHHGSAATTPGVTKNYYRAEISGWSLLSRSDFRAGWYEDEALQELFPNEQAPSGPPSEGGKPEGEKDSSMALMAKPGSAPEPLPAGRTYALVFDSKADAIVNVLNSIANDRETVNALGLLASQSFEEDKTELELRTTLERDQLEAELEALFDALTPLADLGDDDDAARAALRDTANRIASELGQGHNPLGSFSAEERKRFSDWLETELNALGAEDRQ